MNDSKQPMKKLLLLSMLVSMFLWGVSWPSAKIISSYSTPINLAAYRYFIVVLTLLPMLLIFKIDLKVKKQGIPIILLAGSLLAFYSYLLFMGLQRGFSGAGGIFVTTLNPIMAYVIGLAVQGKRPNRNETIGLILGLLAGCVLLKVWENLDAITSSGNIYFLLSAFVWALMSRLTAIGNKYGSPFSFSLWMYVITFLALLPFMDWQDFQHTLSIRDWNFWLNLLFGAAVVTSIATTVYFYATTKLGSEKASSFIFLVPLAAGFSAWIWLGERIELHTILGGGLGILAVYALNRKSAA